jgi:hypothetical protein
MATHPSPKTKSPKYKLYLDPENDKMSSVAKEKMKN